MTPSEDSAEARDDELHDLLTSLQLAIVAHPIAAQAAFRTLVAEGRAFAETPAGQRWASMLVDSPLIQRGRMVWDVTTLRMLDDDPETVLPTTLMDAFVRTTAMEVLEPFLSKLFEKTFDD